MASTPPAPLPLHGGLLLLLLLLPLLTITTTAASSAPLPLLALLSLKSSLVDPAGALRLWTYAAAASSGATHSPAPPWCAWPGITCSTSSSSSGDIISIDLSRRNLSGDFPSTAARLLAPTLTALNLSGNAFSGTLPMALFQLRRLESLDLSRNFLNGTLPAALGELRQLVVLDAFSNCFSSELPGAALASLRRLETLNLGGSYFNGTIPPEISRLRRLKFLNLAGNALTGQIPLSLGDLSSLEHLEIGYNAYDTPIPSDLFRNLTQLRYLDLAGATLTGELPPSLVELRRLESLFLFKNRLAGVIPPELFSGLNALCVLDLSDNLLAGAIPSSLGELHNLTTLNLMSNNLSGEIPPAIAGLPYLEVLQLWNNSLAGALPPSLGAATRGGLVRVDVSSNSLSGPIPAGLCAGGRLARLILFGNRFNSSIPASLSTCHSLWRVRLESNSLSGEIPAGLGTIANLTYLDLSDNSLTGGVPADLVASPSLEFLNISGNPLGGKLPDVTWHGAIKLQVFAASHCKLAGEIPAFGAAGCENLYRLELAGNDLTGGIPDDIGTCKRLVSLRLQHNHLAGEIPAALAALPSITEVDLSWNNLTGAVPPAFANSTTLETFDVSFNHLSPASDVGDGGRNTGERRRNAEMWVSAAAVAFAGMAVLAVTARWLQWRDDGNAAADGGSAREVDGGGVGQWRMTAFQKVGFTADEVARCVEGTSEGIVGAGASGAVYRAKMPDGEVIAVKKLWRPAAAEKDPNAAAPAPPANAEVEVLGSLRHRNIVRLLGWCTNGEATMLLYEYMPNGSLEDLLHGGAGVTAATMGKQLPNKAAAQMLGWEARRRIAVGVAQGVSYLHHDCRPAVVHRDIKPSNILLDADMEPRVADFGVAKALRGGTAMSAVAGSYGYIAPEYTYTLRVDEKSDVYSYGVVLLEILTGQRAVEAEYGEGSTIVDWVRRKAAATGGGGAGEVVDAALWEGETDGEAREEMAMALRVALACTSRSPQERPSMRDVVSMLHEASRGRNVVVEKKQAQPKMN
ncbi:unnamed protein product [Urochloa humidicola]